MMEASISQQTCGLVENGIAAQRDEFREIMKREADRVAKLFGSDEAWSN